MLQPRREPRGGEEGGGWADVPARSRAGFPLTTPSGEVRRVYIYIPHILIISTFNELGELNLMTRRPTSKPWGVYP